MEKITDKIAAIPKDGNYFSLEFFPPKTQMVSDAHVLAFCTAVTDEFAGLFELTNTTRTYVPCPSTSIRNSDMGRWR